MVLSLNCNGLCENSHPRKDMLRSLFVDIDPNVVFLQELGSEGSQFLDVIGYVVLYAKEEQETSGHRLPS